MTDTNDNDGSPGGNHQMRISEGTRIFGRAASFLHGEESGEIEKIQERGRVAVRWDSGYSNYSLGSFLGLLREGYFEVVE